MSLIKVIYTGHSGFLVDTGSRFLLFDLFRDDAGVLGEGLPRGGEGAVFVSHSHADHFNRDVFNMGRMGKTLYIVDAGVEAPYSPCDVKKVSPYQEVDAGWGRIKAFGSTDEGSSFLVEADGWSIFHAGDLNDWYWEEESTPEELAEDEQRYKEEIARIRGNAIDVAFLPVDLRLGGNATRGAVLFAGELKPKFIVPMHTNGELGRELLPSALLGKGLRTAVVHMSSPGEEALIEP